VTFLLPASREAGGAVPGMMKNMEGYSFLLLTFPLTIGIRRGVSKREEDGCRPPGGHRRVTLFRKRIFPDCNEVKVFF
jgi:hypothetical protein